MDYKRCNKVDMDLVYLAYKNSFCDYIIKVDLKKEEFIKRFFGPEGNLPRHSFIALDGEIPVGLVLGGIKKYEGRKTMRCGMMGVIPSFRGRGVSKELFDRHRTEAPLNGCKQLFLEVIKKNLMARAFYRRMGYKKIYDLHYFDLTNFDAINERVSPDFEIVDMNPTVLEPLRTNLKDVHINWQNDVEYILSVENQFTYGIQNDGKTTAVISINKNAKVNFLWVDPNFREQGMASSLLAHCIKELDLKKISAGFANNASLEMFLYRLGFKKDKFMQDEMYLSI